MFDPNDRDVEDTPETEAEPTEDVHSDDWGTDEEPAISPTEG